MVLKKVGGDSFLVNLLSDFILNKIPSVESSIIKVVDCGNFFIIKGKTSSKEILNISEIISEFTSKFQSYLDKRKLTHTIDLIEYDCKLDPTEEIRHRYHNSKNCSYPNENEFNNYEELVYVSSFPHGYSLSQGRLFYYYGKHIFYNIPSNYPIQSLTLTISSKKNSDGEIIFEVFDETTKQYDSTLKSAILDVFDFDMTKIEKEIKKMDWSFELTNPLEEYEFLKNKVGGLIII